MAMSTRTTSKRTNEQTKYPALRRLAAAVALIGAAVVATVMVRSPAWAQQVAVMVNGDPITTYDIDQRIKFTQLATHKTPNRQEVIDELINEKLKIQIAKRYKLDITDNDVDGAYKEMGRRMRLTGEQLTKMLEQAGIGTGTLKHRIRADMSWQQIVRGKFQASLQLRDKDVAEKLQTSNREDKDALGFEYTLRPILFLVDRGATEAVIDNRKREAEALRSRFDGCDTGLAFAKALRGVVVRDQIVKASSDLPAPQRKLLEETSVGKLTSPEVTQQGIEVVAVCAKKENRLDAAARKEVRDEMFNEQFQAQAKRYLQELRKGAMIEVK